jgi:hypothetical protein
LNFGSQSREHPYPVRVFQHWCLELHLCRITAAG